MRLTDRVHAALTEVLRPGDLAIDATVGNGHDVAFLAQLVGSSGKVHAFDLQQTALMTAEEKLSKAGLLDRCVLHHASHERMAEILPPETRGSAQVIVFNLGYLPGSDKSIVTTAASTLAALTTAIRWLAVNGLLAVTAYRGHPGGMKEADQVEEYLASLPGEDFQNTIEKPSANPTSPVAHLIRKKKET